MPLGTVVRSIQQFSSDVGTVVITAVNPAKAVVIGNSNIGASGGTPRAATAALNVSGTAVSVAGTGGAGLSYVGSVLEYY